MTTRDEAVRLGGAVLRYRVAGTGRTVLHLNQDRPHRLLHLRGLTDVCTVIEIDPLGFGRSDRPSAAPAIPSLRDQIAAVLDFECVRDCVGWGYSQGAAMAALVASTDDRFSGVICGGSTLAYQMTESEHRRLQRSTTVPLASKLFWKQFMAIDWEREISTSTRPRLLYLGALDRRRISIIERHSIIYRSGSVRTEVLDGLDHSRCNSDPALTDRVIPLVREWLRLSAA